MAKLTMIFISAARSREILKHWMLYINKNLSMPKSLKPSSNLTAFEVLEQYIKEPEAFWYGIGLRQADKVRNVVQAFSNCGFNKPDKLANHIIKFVRRNHSHFNRPFFIMGLGGSGTTWLGAMLGDLSGFQYGREIYIPPIIHYLYNRYKNQEMAYLIWSIMILHTWGLNRPDDQFRHEFINSARSVFSYNTLHEIWPSGRFIYLARDPRDQIISVTYRKMKYRHFIKPGMNDRNYLLFNAKKYMKVYNRFKKISRKNILLSKYEDLKGNTSESLKNILNHFKLTIPESELLFSVYRNSADNMRMGKVEWRGNLDEGGVAKKWHNVLTDNEKKMIRPIIQKSLIELGYERDENW